MKIHKGKIRVALVRAGAKKRPVAAIDSKTLLAFCEVVDAAHHLYERVQMDESVGTCLSERGTTLVLGEALSEFEWPE